MNPGWSRASSSCGIRSYGRYGYRRITGLLRERPKGLDGESTNESSDSGVVKVSKLPQKQSSKRIEVRTVGSADGSEHGAAALEYRHHVWTPV